MRNRQKYTAVYCFGCALRSGIETSFYVHVDMVFSKFVDPHFTVLLFSSGRLYRSTVIKRCKFEPGSTFTGFSNFLFDLIFCWKDFPWPEVRKNFIVSYVRCTHMCDTYAEINLRGSLKAEGKIFLYTLSNTHKI